MIYTEKNNTIMCERCGRAMKIGYSSDTFYATGAYDDCYCCFSWKNVLQPTDTPHGLLASARKTIKMQNMLSGLERSEL